MCKCDGCGVELQSIDKESLGYTRSISNTLCERCFRIRNYNEYKTVIKDNNEFLNILDSINQTKDLTILVVDLFNINKNLNIIGKHITNNILLVLTKRDLLPKSCYDKKILEYFNNYNLNIVDSVIISSKNNYNYDELYKKINEYKITNNVYVVGFTNSGKSTMINKILYNYSTNNTVITTSNLPSTTIDSIEVNVNDDLTLIDTPGILDNSDIINYLDSNEIKRVIPDKEIKPITYQIKTKQSLYIDNLVRLDISDYNSITLYMSNKLKVERVYKDKEDLKNLKLHIIEVDDDSDIVIQGLMFIHVIKKCTVKVYVKEDVSVFTRKSLM